MDEGLPDQSEKCCAAVQTCSTDENSGPTDPGGERDFSSEFHLSALNLRPEGPSVKLPVKAPDLCLEILCHCSSRC